MWELGCPGPAGPSAAPQHTGPLPIESCHAEGGGGGGEGGSTPRLLHSGHGTQHWIIHWTGDWWQPCHIREVNSSHPLLSRDVGGDSDCSKSCTFGCMHQEFGWYTYLQNLQSFHAVFSGTFDQSHSSELPGRPGSYSHLRLWWHHAVTETFILALTFYFKSD